ncbi:MAG: polyketide synthase, partial [Gammaproteobacteria bacterium]|nr:polyketide synthase [Gammaproteobacteria bacterium]
DHIHAVIKGSAVNNDGSSKVGYLAPSVEGQAAAIAEAMAVADVTADTIEYVECHGTGTPVGDPIEISALTQAFRESTEATGFCRIGSVKTNIGHLDTAAGVASLIKAALTLENEHIPPSLNFEAPNPEIDFPSTPFQVADALRPWPRRATPRRAAVNSLGVGGTNAFVILQEAPQPAARTLAEQEPHFLMLSARNRKALDEASGRLADWLRDHPDTPLADVAFTLLEGREPFEYRRVLACQSTREAAELLETGDPRRVFNHVREIEEASLVFLLPGGGAQYFQMGQGLYDSEPVFRQHIDRGLTLLRERHGVDLGPVFHAGEADREQITEALDQPSIQLPLTFMVEYALARLWESFGVKPSALMGHSMGENTAACLAGVLSFEDTLGLILLRGQLIEQTEPGGVLSVPMPAEELAEFIDEDLDIAAANGPSLSVASGPDARLDALSARLLEQGVESQRVRVNVAAHSRLLDPILDAFRAHLETLPLSPPQIPIVSNRTGTWLTDEQACDPGYWVEHLRHTVYFAAGVATLIEGEDRVFLEVGPGNMLGSFTRQNPDSPAQRVISSMRHPQDPVPDAVYFRSVIGRLLAVGVDVDGDRLWSDGLRRVPLPTYPFQHAPYWIEPGSGASRSEVEDDRPPRLENLGDWFHEPRWVQQGIVDAAAEPCRWLFFQGRDRVSETLVASLRSAGHTVVTVRDGDIFARVDEHTYTVAPEAGGEGFESLIDSLQEADLLPDRIVHGWLLTQDTAFRPGSSFFHRIQNHGFYALFYLARALSKLTLESPVGLTILANGSQSLNGEPAPYPNKATAIGPAMVVPREMPAIRARYVDVDLPVAEPRGRRGADTAGANGLADRLMEELLAEPGNGVVAWRGDVRYERHVRRVPARRADPAPAPLLRHGATYLVTGGFGGIAGVVTDWLAREYQANLVLLARTPLPARDGWDTWLGEHGSEDSISRAILRVRALEAAGASVLPVAADVTVADQMRDALAAARERFGSVDGVFHTAGVIRDSLIPLKTQREIEDVFSAKVYGTLVLDDLLAREPLDFLCLFSSTSAYVAPQGQIDYVGANSFLNAFADARRGGRYPVIALNWGIWRDVGMVAPGTASVTDALDAVEAVSHELFRGHRRGRQGTLELHRLDGELSADHWLIDDHRLKNGDALLPGTGYIELIRAALEEAGQPGPWRMTNLVFEQPLFVADGATRRFSVSLQGNAGHWQAEVRAADEDGDVLCARAAVAAAPAARPEDVPPCTFESSGDDRVESAGASGFLKTRQEDHLRFGPRWHVLRQIRMNPSGASARLSLAPDHAADLQTFGLHPGLLDIATGYAMDLIPGYADHEVAESLWVPLSYGRIDYYAPLTPEIRSHVRLSEGAGGDHGFAAFDVTLTDGDGHVLVDIERLTLRELEGRFGQAPGAGSAASRSQARTPGEIALEHNASQGIDAASGIQALAAVLSEGARPQTIVSSMDLRALVRQAEYLSHATESNETSRFERPQLDSDFEAPRDDIETALAELWGKLLGVEGVGVHDSFFDLGGHSLIAVRLFNEIRDRFGADLPMSVLMQSPTVAGLAEIVRGGPVGEQTEASAPSGDEDKPAALTFRHVVPMHRGTVGGGTPFFVVAGMFGNVLNLSHLAHLLGEERPFYALQARGLYGDTEPHETFEEMATDYISEMRQVQPHGPYLLGGFSGGGLIAYEIARQLTTAGEQVLRVIMLDTPVPQFPVFSLADKATMILQGIQQNGAGHLIEKVKTRIRWEREQRERAAAPPEDELSFQSRKIGEAFLRALRRYQIPRLGVGVTNLRPKLNIRYRLSGGRQVDDERNYVMADNGWGPFVDDLEIIEVPGNHDSMVLEPNVRVMVSEIRKAIARAHEPPGGAAAAETRTDARNAA